MVHYKCIINFISCLTLILEHWFDLTKIDEIPEDLTGQKPWAR